MEEIRTRGEQREYLRKLISEWNASRLDLFEISEPNEDLEYRGVMRFYFQDAGAKVATKCIRVSSMETAEDVTSSLVEKFRPDMKMLSNPNYSLYVVHPNGESRQLGKTDRPLVVQLSWQEDDRDGRFLLKSDHDALVTKNIFENNAENESGQNFKRKLSKREKKQLKKKREEEAKKAKKDGVPTSPSKSTDDTAIAQTLYNELPETSFTRSISNPEAVMRRRRQQKLERKLQEFQSSDGGSDGGGTLKIFAETLKPEIPYKTLLVSMRDPTTHVVKMALEKYQMEKENPDDYCLVMVNIPPEGPDGKNTLGKERVVHDDDNPLAIAATWPQIRGHVVFHLRRRANLPRYRKEKTRRSKSPSRVPLDVSADRSVAERLANSTYPEHLLPYLLEISSDERDLAKIHRLPMDVTEIGSEKSMSSGGNYLHLFAAHILPRHCVITNMDGIVSVTPCTGDAEVFVDNKRIYETTKLNHGSVVKIGRAHFFRFCDPVFEEKLKRHSAPTPDAASISSGHSVSDNESKKRSKYRSGPPGMHREYEQNNVEMTNDKDSTMFETTFGVDGEIETFASHGSDYREDLPPQIIRTPPDDTAGSGFSDKLPARLEFRESGEDAFFAAVISEVNGAAVHFKLAPTYTLYMCCRYRISPAYRPELVTHQRGERLAGTVQKISNMMRSTVEENNQIPGSLAFWMANSSELLHFLKQDVDISSFSRDSHQVLAQSVQMAFRHLVQCVEQELRTAMSAFLDKTEDADMEDSDVESMNDLDSPDNMEGERSFRYGMFGRPLGGDSWLGGRRRHSKPTVSDILFTLSSAMSLLRRCRVNAALTIQVFSQLFHYINMWIFNKVVLQPQAGLCTRDWGVRLRRRLARVESWAQKQGLELAAEFHLGRVIQTAHLLQSPKNSHNDINSISSACFKLNSLQLRALLENYRPAPDELGIPRDLIDSVVAVAENTADEHIRSQGQDVVLEEDPQLQLPFLLPEDSYSCEVILGVPAGLKEFLEPLDAIGLCRLTVQPMSSGLWTVYQGKHRDSGGDMPTRTTQSQAPEIMDVSFHKGRGGMGLSIVAAKGVGQDKLGIYVKQVVKDGPAAKDGRLQAGDQLLSVNGESLIGVPQERAAELMVKSGANVSLRVAKQGAIYHGLATLLSQPSPMVSKEPRPLVAVDAEEEVIQASPTISEQHMQRAPTRWLPQEYDQSFRRPEESRNQQYQEQWRGEDRRRHDEQRRQAEEERVREERERRYWEEEERRLQEERRQADEQRRLEEERRRQEEELRKEEERRFEAQQWRAEEQRRLEEDRRRAEEQLRLEERRRAEEQRRLEEERRQAEEQRRFEEQRRAEEQRRFEEERRRAEQQRRLEEERKRAEEERRLEEDRRREEERRRAEQYAEERRLEEARLREERRLADEARRLEEERRREEERRLAEQRRFEEERRKQEIDRKRAENALKIIGEQQRRQKKPNEVSVSTDPSRPTSYRVRFEPEENDRERRRPPLTIKVEEPELVAKEEKSGVYASPVPSPSRVSPNMVSPKESTSHEQAPTSPIRVDSHNTRYGRFIMITQSPSSPGGAQTRPSVELGQVEPDYSARDPKENERRQHEKETFTQWQREEMRRAADREAALERVEREEKERREEEERAWRRQLEKQRREQEIPVRSDRDHFVPLEREGIERERQRVERERQERERRERERQERENAERERQDRERQERDRRERERVERERRERERIEREKQERERAESLEKRRREEQEREQQVERERLREEREHDEEERIMNEMEKEEQEEQREREKHLRQLEEEQQKLRSLEQARLRGGTGSKEYLDLIESLSPDEVEREFQKRLEEEKRKKEAGEDEVIQERAAGGLVSVTHVKYQSPNKEERIERGRKIDLLIQDNARRERERKEAELRRKQKEEEEEKLLREKQMKRLQQLELDREQQREAQRRIQDQRQREQEEWLKQQRERRDQQRIEQERLRLEKKMQEEEERNKKRQEIQQRRDLDDQLRRQSQLQKEEAERRLAEVEREAEARRETERRKHFEEQRIVREKEEQVRRQQADDQRLKEGKVRRPSTEDHVNELKGRATADWEKRRSLIDDEINRRRSEPVSALRHANSSRPKKQVSFSNVATEIREPVSPTYVVGTPSGYTARVTPAPSVRYVNTRVPNVGSSRAPPLDEDDEDLPPPPPPPPPEELLDDDSFPPPPPPKSTQSLERFTALSGAPPTRAASYTSRVTISQTSGTREQADYPSLYSSTGVPLRQPPVSSTSGYPSYATLPRKPRPVSYPSPYEMSQSGPPGPPGRYGSQENILDGPSSRPQSQYTPKPARLDNDDFDSAEVARARLARISLTDEEKSEGQAGQRKPEKLGFRDKLKMFNEETPQEKVRSSKWQKEQMAQLNGDVSP